MGELTAVGIGIGFLTLEDKETFWDTGVFSFDTAQSLLNTKFYYKEKSLDCQERKGVKVSMRFNMKLKLIQKINYSRFNSPPTFQINVHEGLKYKNVENQNVKHYEQPGPRRWRSRLERSPRKRKVGCSNFSRDRLK